MNNANVERNKKNCKKNREMQNGNECTTVKIKKIAETGKDKIAKTVMEKVKAKEEKNKGVKKKKTK